MQKKNLWLWILGWLIFFPIPLTVLIVRSGKLGKTLKGVILTLLWLPIVLLGIAGSKAEPETVDVDKAVTETVETIAETTTSAETATVETTAETTTEIIIETTTAAETTTEATTTTETTTTTAETTTAAAEPTARPHREEAVGVSYKDIADLKISFDDSVRNDVTGKWRLTRIAESNIDISEYALSYYNTYFKSDDEIHAIVNFTAKTTTSISYYSGMIFVDVHEYIEDEEHDANELFSGKLLKQYIVYADNGDIEPIEDDISDYKADTDSASSDSVSDTVIALISPVLDKSFPEENKIEYDSDLNVYNISVWHDGIAAELTLSGTDHTSWDNLVSQYEELCNSLWDVAKAIDSDANVTLSILNDLNKDNVLLMIYNGVTFYNAAE